MKTSNECHHERHQMGAKKRKQQAGRFIAVMLMAMLAMPFCLMTVAAANPFGDFSDDFKNVYNIAKSVMLPCAALGVMYGGLCFLGIDLLSQRNTEKQIEKGKLIIRYACVSVALFYLLPAVINLSVNTFSGNAWKPDEPNGYTNGAEQHEHTWITQSQIAAPTCTTNGIVSRICSSCSKTETHENRDMLGHDWTTINVIEVATCETAGKEQRKCKRCEITETTIIQAGHVFNPQGVCMRCEYDKYKPTQ